MLLLASSYYDQSNIIKPAAKLKPSLSRTRINGVSERKIGKYSRNDAGFGLIGWVYGISTLIGYLMPNPVNIYIYDS